MISHEKRREVARKLREPKESLLDHCGLFDSYWKDGK